MINVDLSGALPFLESGALKNDALIRSAFKTLIGRNGAGKEYTGWLRLPETFDRGELQRIERAAQKIRAESDALVVIGIGGSYLGAKAALDLLKTPNYNLLPKDTPDIFFVGNNLSPAALGEVLRLVRNRNFSVNVISKSGTTTEPAIAFRIFRDLLEDKYGDIGMRERIYATTDKTSGALRQMAETEGYETFVVPGDIGGRYSVLSAVGLLPMAAAGIDIRQVLTGAQGAMEQYCSDSSMSNPVWQYAGIRQALAGLGKTTEILGFYEPSFRFMAEWWKQLFGESEGKDGKGIFPASVELTSDLHSLGQYIQDGQRMLFETVVSFDTFGTDISVPASRVGSDGLAYLEGKGLSFINGKAMEATAAAHVAGGVPNIRISLPGINPEIFGELVYFFEVACGVSGYMTGVNPFDQPGVEAYKKNMFSLLGKPGF